MSTFKFLGDRSTSTRRHQVRKMPGFHPSGQLLGGSRERVPRQHAPSKGDSSHLWKVIMGEIWRHEDTARTAPIQDQAFFTSPVEKQDCASSGHGPVGNSDSNNGAHWNNTRPISKLHRGLESERRRIGDLPFGVGPENVLELGAEIDTAIDMDVVVGFQNHLVALRRGGGIADRNA